MNADFIRPSDPRWAGFLARVPHDVYHLPEYVACVAEHDGGTPEAFYAESSGAALLAPLVIRDLPATLAAPADWCDAVAPYGYGSPLASSGGNPDALRRCSAAFREAAADRGIVSAFLRMHPLLPLPAEAVAPLGEPRPNGQVVYVDLRRSPEELWSETRGNHRTGIKRLRRDGFVALMDEWRLYGEFGPLYRETMRRAEAAGYYFFSDAYFEDLRTRLSDRLHLCTVLAPTGVVAAAGLFFVTDGIVQYHLGATAGEFLSKAPSKLMFDSVRSWAREDGRAVLHLGGGLGGREDSLFHFKAGFSPLRADFHTLRVVLDADKYAALEARAGGRADSDFFPAYRQAPAAAPALQTTALAQGDRPST